MYVWKLLYHYIVLECSKPSKCQDYVCPNGKNCQYRICTGLLGTIGCEAGSLLNLTSVWWGRTTVSICPVGQMNTSCVPDTNMITKFLENGKRICDNERSCSLRAAYNFADACGNHLWGDPCPNRSKYLLVNFTCNPGGKSVWLFFYGKNDLTWKREQLLKINNRFSIR